MIYLALIFLGLCLGSFINALMWRLHEQSKYYDDAGKPKKLSTHDRKRLDELSIATGRSMCTHCGHQLAAKDLVPLLSWLYLRGKCRYCKKPIDDTPVAEVLLPVLLVLSYAFWSFAQQGWDALHIALFVIWIAIMTCFVALALYDARWFLLPDRIVLPLTLLSVLFVVIRSLDSGSYGVAISAALGALAISGTFWLLSVVSKGEWIGWGDVKLGLSLGLLAGTPLLAGLVIFLASLLGTAYVLVGTALGAIKTEKTSGFMKTMLPFGPFLIAATFVVVLWGEPIIQWYSDLFLL